MEDIIKLVDDTVYVAEEGVLESRFGPDTDYATFIRLTENARRDREDRLREGDESAKVVIINPQVTHPVPAKPQGKKWSQGGKWKQPEPAAVYNPRPSGGWVPPQPSVAPVWRQPPPGYGQFPPVPMGYAPPPQFNQPINPLLPYGNPALKRPYQGAPPVWGQQPAPAKRPAYYPGHQ